MVLLACFLMLAAPAQVELVNETYTIPPGQWRYIPLGLNQQAAMVISEFHTEPAGEVRMALLRRADLDHLRDGVPHGMLASTPSGSAGSIRHHVGIPGEYELVVSNQGESPATIHMQVKLDFGPPPGPAVTSISPARQLAVVVISFGVFFGIVLLSGRRLLRAVRQDPPRPPE